MSIWGKMKGGEQRFGLALRPGAGGSGLGQGDREGRALTWLAFDHQPAAVAGDDMLDDRQPQPGATQRARPAVVDAVEPFGQPHPVFGRDAGAVVAHRNHQGGAVDAGHVARRG